MRVRKALVSAAVAGAAVVVLAIPASAHVTVDPDSAPKGAGDATLTFRVPNEEPSADTTQVDVQFPTDHPIAAIEVATPPAGWTATITKKHLDKPITTDDGSFSDVVSEISWTGGKIPPGQYGEFKVLAMGLPDDVSSLSFPTVQTYSDGTTVSWIEASTPGADEPQHPAPSLKLTSVSSDAAAAATKTVVKKETSNGLAIAALVVGGIGVLLALGSLARKPKSE